MTTTQDIENIPDLIGITGQKQSGKSTAAEALVSLGYVADAFADDLKSIIYRTQGIYVPIPRENQLKYGFEKFETYQNVIDTIGIDLAKEIVPSIRRILQTFGSESVRDTLGEDMWANQVINRVKTRRLALIKTVVPDVRFENELNILRANGGVIIRIIRPSQKSINMHRSEIEIQNLDVDYEIINDGSIKDLQQKIIDLFA